jgi:hypothetical protein
MPEYCFIQGCPNQYRGKKTLGATTNVTDTDPKKSRLFCVPKDDILKKIWSEKIPMNGTDLKTTFRLCLV